MGNKTKLDLPDNRFGIFPADPSTACAKDIYKANPVLCLKGTVSQEFFLLLFILKPLMIDFTSFQIV
jgi:hypothetical protein